MNITFFDVMLMSINKERYWLMLTLLCLEAWSRTHDISMFVSRNVGFIVKATTLRM